MFSRFSFVLLFFTLAAQPQVHAHSKIRIQEMNELLVFPKEAPASDTLYVFDIDNTLLRTKIDLGGDAWFTWQEDLLKINPASPDLVAPDFGGLITVQGWMYALGQMIPPEVTTPELFRRLQDEGHPVILLTSRGPDFENLTNKELSRNGYNPGLAAIEPKEGFAAPFIPYDLENPAAACLTEDDVRRLALVPARPVIYRNGIMMTSGQHKGAMLRTLLCKLGKTYKNIYFIDDHLKHVKRMFEAYIGQPGDVISVQYGQMDEQVEEFKNSDKSEVRAQWKKLKAVIDDIFN